MEERSTLEAIHQIIGEMEETRIKIKTVKNNLRDVMEQNDDYRAIADQLKELTAKRAEMKKILSADKDYQAIAADAEELKFKLKDLQEIMSHHLVSYYNDTHSMQIKDPDGEVRQVLLSAKIGKPEVDIRDRKSTRLNSSHG